MIFVVAIQFIHIVFAIVAGGIHLSSIKRGRNVSKEELLITIVLWLMFSSLGAHRIYWGKISNLLVNKL